METNTTSGRFIGACH